MSKSSRVLPYALLFPGFFFLCLLIIYPSIDVVFGSFTNQSFIRLTRTIIGFLNYQRLVQDNSFFISFFNSFIFVVGVVGLSMLLGMGLALILNENIIFKGLWRGLVLVPWIVPPVVTALTWGLLYNPAYGPITNGLILLGILPPGGTVGWIQNPDLAMFSLIIAATWRYFPFCVVMILAGLQAIPADQYEASMLDGANSIQRFIHVTVPNLRYILTITFLINTIWAFKHVDIPMILTNGGPLLRTEVLALHIWKTAFHAYQIGYADSMAMTLLAILMGFAILYFRALKFE